MTPGGATTSLILSILGINLIDGAKGLIQTVRWLKGRKVAGKVVIEDGNTRLETSHGDALIVATPVGRIADEPQVRHPLERFTEPLRDDGIEVIRFEKRERRPRRSRLMRPPHSRQRERPTQHLQAALKRPIRSSGFTSSRGRSGDFRAALKLSWRRLKTAHFGSVSPTQKRSSPPTIFLFEGSAWTSGSVRMGSRLSMRSRRFWRLFLRRSSHACLIDGHKGLPSPGPVTQRPSKSL